MIASFYEIGFALHLLCLQLVRDLCSFGNQAGFVCIRKVCYRLLLGRYPAIANEQSREIPLAFCIGLGITVEDRLTNIRDVLTGVRLSRNVYLRRISQCIRVI